MAYQIIQDNQTPHTTKEIMMKVILATIPLLAVMAWLNPLWLIQPLVAAAAAYITEMLFEHFRSTTPKQDRFALKAPTDHSALVTGVLLGICLPPEAPLWIPVIGGIFSIAFSKQVYGGLGANPFNPAMVAYVMLLLGFPTSMTDWSGLTGVIDGVSQATLLDRSQELSRSEWAQSPLFSQTIALAIAALIGGLWLWQQKIIKARIPVAVILGFVVMQWYLLEGSLVATLGLSLQDCLVGAVVFGAIFIATDPVSAPQHPKSQILFGIGIGVLTAIIRDGQQYPDGFAFAVLLMNIAGPSLDRIMNMKPREPKA